MVSDILATKALHVIFMNNVTAIQKAMLSHEAKVYYSTAFSVAVE